uniref:Uncharacterized protein n=1 Tax=Mycolicibacterium phage phi1_186018 TaxID=3236641 RepID=A0AB39AKT3_9CAUD
MTCWTRQRVDAMAFGTSSVFARCDRLQMKMVDALISTT